MTQLDLTDAMDRPPRRPVGELKPGERVDQVFAVSRKDLRATSSGGLYIHAVVSDRTGEMVARMWQASQEIYATIPDGGLLRIRGRIDSYKGNPQLIVEGLQPADMDAVDLGEFLPTTANDMDEMVASIRKAMGQIQDAGLSRLVQSILADEELMTRFKASPAASRNHHAYIGGLCEHTLGLLRAAAKLLPLYPNVNRDLVMAGLFLHDIGKTDEISSRMGFEYTDDGQLLGHIYAGAAYVQRKADELSAAGEPIDERLLKLLIHIILSHHGLMEFGAPVLPKTREALFVHYLDNLDAKMNTLDRLINAGADEGATWTSYDPSLGRRIYRLDYASPHSTPDESAPRKGGLE